MKDKAFVDSNVLLCLLSGDERKKDIAKDILKANPIISTQVMSENVNTLFKKFKELDTQQITQHVNLLLSNCSVCPISVSTIEKALELKVKYRCQWYDSTILSAAVLSDCNILYSEDMQHDQKIEGNLKIINPFL